MNRIFIPRFFIIITSVCLIFWGCGSSEKKIEPFKFSFAVFGNTLPDSPFVGYPDRLEEIINMINGHNPMFVLHTGDIVHGGKTWMGITIEDMNRQLNHLSPIFSGISSSFYTVAGDKDYYEGDPQLYRKNFKRKANYSFKCSAVKFIVFNTVSEHGDPESDLKWLKSELDTSRGFAFIVIFTHNSIFNYAGVKGIYSEAEKFHEIVADSPVKIVISGNPAEQRSFSVDSVKYYIAGTAGYSLAETNRRLYQYFIFELTDETVEITGFKLQR